MEIKVAKTNITYFRQFPADMSDEEIQLVCWYTTAGKFEEELMRGSLSIGDTEINVTEVPDDYLTEDKNQDG